jgi:hypothetical protein
MGQPKVKHVVHDYVSVDVDGEETDLPVRLAPGECMHYVEYIVERPTPNTLVIGYLIEDGDAGNPLEDSEGMGKIYSAHRHASRTDHYEMQKALGLDDYWNPDTDNELVEPEARRAHPEVRWDAANVSYEDIKPHLMEAWKKLLAEGKIGNPNAVMLDCYEHGGQHWSVSGGGMQCQWDTAQGAGLWAPDDSCMDHIRSTALERVCNVKIQWEGDLAVARINGLPQIACKDWRDTVSGVQKFIQTEANQAELRRVEREVAVECAEQALESYNSWLAGNVYGVVVCDYVRAGTEDDFDLVNSDECWGHVGTDWAKEALRDTVTGAVGYLKEGAHA